MKRCGREFWRSGRVRRLEPRTEPSQQPMKMMILDEQLGTPPAWREPERRGCNSHDLDKQSRSRCIPEVAISRSPSPSVKLPLWPKAVDRGHLLMAARNCPKRARALNYHISRIQFRVRCGHLLRGTPSGSVRKLCLIWLEVADEGPLESSEVRRRWRGRKSRYRTRASCW